MQTIRKKLGGLKKQLDKSLGDAKALEEELAETNAKADGVSCVFFEFLLTFKVSRG